MKFRRLREEMKRCKVTTKDIADTIGCSQRAVEMKMAMVKGSCWRLDEMYKVMAMLAIPWDEMHLVFPMERIVRRAG